MLDPLAGVDGLDATQEAMIRANHATNLTALEGFHKKAVDATSSFYTGVKEASLGLDNTLQFTCENVSHIDGQMADLARSKLLTIFRKGARGWSF